MDRLSLIATRQSRSLARDCLFAALITVATLIVLISLVVR